MTGADPLELPGLRGGHPLGFLAACGLLHCLKDFNEFGATRLAWARSQDSGAFIASLYAEQKPDIACLTKIINERCGVVRRSPAYKWSTKIDDREKYRNAACTALSKATGSSEDLDVLAAFPALASDLASTDKGALQSTLLDLTSGNQQLLKSIVALADDFDKPAICEALHGPWRYKDDHHSLGWDPQTQRLHALRHKLPEKDKAHRSVRAAIFLATQAMPFFPCFVQGGRLHTTGFYRDDNGEDWFSWPIWSTPITLDTLCSLLVHPFTTDLMARGVEIVYHSRRASTGGEKGDYRVFSHASERPWPAPRRETNRSHRREA